MGFSSLASQRGGLYLLDCDPQQVQKSSKHSYSSKPIELTLPKLGWFYHIMKCRDMNGDGRLDPLNPSLVVLAGNCCGWNSQPPESPLTSVPWKEHVLASGPDMIIVVVDLDEDDKQFEVFACRFFSECLSVLTISTTNATVIQERDIDTTICPAYDAIFVDLNIDSGKELHW